jgi:hypothetical protein
MYCDFHYKNWPLLSHSHFMNFRFYKLKGYTRNSIPYITKNLNFNSSVFPCEPCYLIHVKSTSSSKLVQPVDYTIKVRGPITKQGLQTEQPKEFKTNTEKL